jgi:Mg2+/Co2+ transporter CorB
MSNLTFILITLTCLLLSAFFSAAETSITAVSLGKMKKLESDGVKAASKILKLREQKEVFLGTLLIGNNAATIFASSVSAVFAASIFGEEGVVYSTFILTLLIIIFAEVLPKTLAFRNPEMVALKTANLLAFVVRILKPLTLTTKFIVEGIIKFTTNETVAINMSIMDELRGTLALHEDQGAVKKVDKDMLGGVFNLDEMHLEDVMLHRKFIYSINIGLSNDEIISKALGSGYSKIPLWKDTRENIVGILDLKEVVKFIATDKDALGKLNLSDFVSKPWYVPMYTTLKKQLHSFRERKNHFAIVIDEYGDIQGIVTLVDILEEIVGGIEDSNGKAATENDFVKKTNDCYLVNADFSVRHFMRDTDFKLPELDATTVGGIVLCIAGRIPDIEEVIEFESMRYTIVEKNGKKLHKILIERIKKEDN